MAKRSRDNEGETKRSRRFHWSVMLAVGAALVLSAIAAVRDWGPTPGAVRDAAMPFTLTCMALLLVFTVALALRRFAGRGAGNVTLGFFAGVLAVMALVRLAPQPGLSTEELVKEVNATRFLLLAPASIGAGSSVGPVAAVGQLETAAAEWDRRATDAPRSRAGAYRALAQLAREWRLAAEPYARALHSFGSPMDVRTAADVASLDERLEKLAAATGGNERLGRFLELMESRLGALLAEAGVSESQAAEVAVAFMRIARADEQVRLRQADAEVLAIMTDIVRTYRDHWGRWRTDARGVLWNDTATADRLNQRAAEIQEIAARQEEIRRLIATPPRP